MSLTKLQFKDKLHGGSLNITSLMDILVIILVFLLYNVSFEILHLSVVNASIPTIADENTTFKINREAVNMTLQIKLNGLKLTGGNELISEEEMAKLSIWLPMVKGNKYDFSSLTRFLMGVKKSYPKSTNLVIIPEDDVLYDAIVSAMDAAREVPAPKGKAKGAELKPLFPDVVVSRTVK